MNRLSIAIICICLILIFSGGVFGDTIEGKNIFTREQFDIDRTRTGSIDYISLADFVHLINSSLQWDPIAMTATMDTGDHIIKVQLFSPYIVIDNNPHNLIYRTSFRNGSIYVPMEKFIQVCNRILKGELIFYPDENKLDFVPRLFNILDLGVEDKSNGYLITIFLSEKLKHEHILTEEGWLNLTLYGGKIDTSAMARYDLYPAVRSMRAYQFENSAQLSFLLKDKNANFTINDRDEPARITISINSAPSEQGFTGIPTWRKNNIEMIVIDPGHGGEDPGAIGRVDGTREKDVVLDISRRVAAILRKKGLKVVMTREKDEFIPLGERTQMANRLGADLFVSIHANASERIQPRGCQTFFLARAKNDEARATAALENSALRFEKEDNPAPFDEASDLDFILMDIVQNEYLKESSDLAELIQNRFDGNLEIPNRGIDQAGFYVLNRAYMPAVLVETAFISNEIEEELLRKRSFRKALAESIAEGILDFKKKYQGSDNLGYEKDSEKTNRDF
jgi:N-acetylmuramoyl-L-alanine amidase